jgi:hypothetical protein
LSGDTLRPQRSTRANRKAPAADTALEGYSWTENAPRPLPNAPTGILPSTSLLKNPVAVQPTSMRLRSVMLRSSFGGSRDDEGDDDDDDDDDEADDDDDGYITNSTMHTCLLIPLIMLTRRLC